MAEHFKDFREPDATELRLRAVERYVEEHTSPEHPYLHALYRATHLHLVRPHMASGNAEGQLLTMLVGMLRPKRILEIGTYSGYSALSMARGLQEGAKIVTYEINDEIETFTRSWIDGSPWAERVDFRIGDVMKDLGEDEEFDLVFIDGNKRDYADYYELSLRHLRPQGFILADNTLWDGHIVDPAYDRDAQTLGIRRFNDLVASDGRVEAVIIPLRDGLTLIRKKE